MDQEFFLIADIVVNHFNMKQGLKRFGQSGISAVDNKGRHLVTMDALETDNPKELIIEDCRAVMAYLMFLKDKRDVTIKDQGCCDGRVQRYYMTKEETILPTIMKEIFVATCIIYAMEGRDVAISDITGAFLQMDMVHGDRTVRVRLCCILSDLMVKIDP